jgi:hypothetical protein
VSATRGRFSKRQTKQQLQASRDREGPKAGAPAFRALVANDWRQLSEAARQEHDPKKFAYFLKRLYDVLNEGEKELSVSSTVDRRLANAA